MSLVKKTKSSPKYGTLRGLIGSVRERGFGVDHNVRTYRAIRGIRDVHGRARGSLPSSAYEAYFSYINAFSSEMLRQVPLKGYSNVAALVEMPALSLQDEIHWNLARIKAGSDEISNVLRCRREIERSIWLGDHSAAFQKMSDTAEEFGESLWLIEKRVFLHQLSGGLRAQKEYVSRLKATLKGGLTPFLAHHFSVRNEPSTTAVRFVSDVRERCGKIEDKELGAYLDYRLTRQWPNDEASIANILRVEQNNATIDVYETFLSLISTVQAGGLDLEIDTSDLVGQLANIGDERLEAGSGCGNQKASESMISAFVSGNYREVLRRHAVLRTPSIHGIILGSICRALARPIQRYAYREHRSLSNILVSRFAECLRGGVTAAKSAADLAKLALNAHDGGIVDAMCRLAQADLFDRENIKQTSSAVTIPFRRDPLVATLEVRQGDIVGLIAELSESDLYTRHLAPGDDIAAVVAACKAATSNDYDRMLLQLRPLCVDSRDAVSNFAFLMGLEMSAKHRRVDEFMELLADSVVRFDEIALSPSVRSYAAQLRWRDISGCAGSLKTAVAAHHLLKKGAGKSWGTSLRFSIDAFLEAQGIKRPSEIVPSEHGVALVKHFWKVVCEPDVVDMIRSVDGVRALRLEMRELFSELRAIDPIESEYYESEIVQITHSLMIEDGRRIVDQSRIYVDEAAIRESLRVDLAEPFSRYRALAPATADDAKNFDEVVRRAVRGEVRAGDLTFPTSEADQLLVDMITLSCNRFLFDPAHGLDSYLSKRIRHGSIVGHLRGAIEQHGVIYQLNGVNYEPSEDWMDEFANINQMERQEIISSMAEFSRRVDEELLFTRNHVVQIRSAEKKNGLLGINLGASEYHTIRSFVRLDLTFEGFLNSMFATFWGLLNPSLDAVKGHLRGQTALLISEQFSRVRSSVNAKRSKYPEVSELSSCLDRASRDVLAELESVAQWFERSASQAATRRYTLCDAISIGVESSKAAYKGASIKIDEQSVQDLEITVADIPVLADVLLIILGNVYTKSGVHDGAWVRLSCEVRSASETLVIRVNSEVANGVRLSNSSRVDSIRDDISHGRIDQSLRREGESGLKKLAATVRQSQYGKLEFGFVSDQEFFVEVELSLVIDERGRV